MSDDGCICPRFNDTGGFRIADLCCPVHGVEGSALYADGMWEDDATPPLVAASPVPPVVPDSEAREHRRECEWEYGAACHCGSGVVPDKPALAEAVRDVLWRAQRFGETDDGDTAHYIVTKGAMHRLMGAAQAVGIPASFRNDDSTEVPEPIPAVTDDEAATAVIELTLQQHAVSPNDIISDLRSAGFLIVHHTKET